MPKHMGISWYIIDLKSLWWCFLYFTRLVVIIEVIMYYVDIDWLRCIIIPLYWNSIVCMHWHEIEYKLDMWRSFVLGIVRCKHYSLSTWRSFVSVYGPRESPMGHELSMYFRGVSCIYGWVSTRYSETYHYMASYCIALHPIIHSWWLYVSFGVLENIKCWFPLLTKLK